MMVNFFKSQRKSHLCDSRQWYINHQYHLQLSQIINALTVWLAYSAF